MVKKNTTLQTVLESIVRRRLLLGQQQLKSRCYILTTILLIYNNVCKIQDVFDV